MENIIIESAKLNRDIKRLAKVYKKHRSDWSHNTSTWTNQDWARYQKEQDTIKAELARLYYMDSNFDYMNKGSILTMMSINCTLRAITFHVFCSVDLVRTDGDFK